MKASPTRAVECYYTVQEVSLLLRFSERWVRERINEGAFGAGVRDINGDLRIPASGINAFLDSKPRFYDPGIKARNLGELRRKIPKQNASNHPERVA